MGRYSGAGRVPTRRLVWASALWMNQLPLSRQLYAKTRRAISPTRFPGLPPLTMIATGRFPPLTSSRRNIVKSGTPALGPDIRSIATRLATEPRFGALHRDTGGRGNLQPST
jgi:hypothetical protein